MTRWCPPQCKWCREISRLLSPMRTCLRFYFKCFCVLIYPGSSRAALACAALMCTAIAVVLGFSTRVPTLVGISLMVTVACSLVEQAQ